MEADNEVWEKLGKYLSGNSSDLEKMELEKWLDQNPKGQKLLEELQTVWDLSYTSDKTESWNASAALEWIESRAANPIASIPSREKRPLRFLKAIAVAGSLLLFLSIGIWSYQNLFAPSDILTFQAAQVPKELDLPDGSTVWLNSHSELTYKDAMRSRELSLSGEAFFEVKENSQRPFIIHSGAIQTRVVGTSFNLTAYPEDSVIAVSVNTGKVEFGRGDGKGLVLTEGEKGSFDKRNFELREKQKASPNVSSWRTQNLVFENQKLSQVLEDLEKHFKVSFEVGNSSLQECHFTSSFENPELDRVVEVLEFALEVEVKRVDQIYTLSGSGCN